ncbi:MAG: hypothetical protein Hyperionvirus3_135 [Hyperionvirus sp.]|uniref:Uncharacterized protein n=1 Tax=Hyperionvirus sp. TaxID=2487770 RepID=A0A3G5ACC0_9VIRU|nr:MAG: hypothetical protein Hyperionvirus3_135 [Hyperionvirus sp.]
MSIILKDSLVWGMGLDLLLSGMSAEVKALDAADWSEEKLAELAENWKEWFFWDPETEEIVIKPGWCSRHDKIVSHFDRENEWIVHRLVMDPFAVDHPECTAYKQFLEQKMLVAFEKRWNSFKLRPEVRNEKDLVGDEASQLEKKWSMARMVWYDHKTNAIYENSRRYPEKQRAYPFEHDILYAILHTRVRSIEMAYETATRELLENLDQLQIKWASFLDAEKDYPRSSTPLIIQALGNYRQRKILEATPLTKID